MQLDWWKTATIQPIRLVVAFVSLLGAVAELALAFVFHDVSIYLFVLSFFTTLFAVLEMVEAHKVFRKHRQNRRCC